MNTCAALIMALRFRGNVARTHHWVGRGVQCLVTAHLQ